MNDRESITAVLVRYASGIDSRDWDLFRTCFTEDCVIDYGNLGRWNDREAVTRFMQRSHSGPSMHRLSNFAITLDGERARARTYVDALVFGPGGWGGARTEGYYDDELGKTPEGWRIARRRFTEVSIKFVGALGIIPSSVASRLAAYSAQRMNAAANKVR
jgi:hypothetical protein